MMASIGQVSTNPALRHGNFEEAQRSGNWVRQGGDAGMMTMEGTVDKTALLLALTAGAAAVAWQQIYTGAMGVAAVMSVTQGERHLRQRSRHRLTFRLTYPPGPRTPACSPPVVVRVPEGRL
jgi:hypothetical protein